MSALTKIEILGREPDYQGKVRDLYDLGDKMVMVSTDRISAFDVVFKEGIPGRGQILTRISNFWFNHFNYIQEFPNHLIETDINNIPQPFCNYPELLKERVSLVKKCKRIDFECIVRGYLLGSAYSEYKENGKVCGIQLPAGLKKGDRLDDPIFTPSTKADSGHDENVSYEDMEKAIGSEMSQKLKDSSLRIYKYAEGLLKKYGIILADTKFEFGLYNNTLTLIDEVLTPDSSRFIKKDEYEEAMSLGKEIPSMDKQIIRNYLSTLDWDKNPPAPEIPAEILEKTLQKYNEIEKVISCILQET